MPDLEDGESTEMQGSGTKPYVLKNVGGVYSCTCPAWRNQSIAIETAHLQAPAQAARRRGRGSPHRRRAAPAPGQSRRRAKKSAGPPLLLAETWDNAADLTGWWMSEKLDGVRAYWDGKQFLSRQGNLFHAPDWFVDGLPAVPLDGELWIDRKKFQRTVSIVRRQDKSDLWKEVRFLVFDAPSATGGFEERLAFVKDALANGHRQVRPAARARALQEPRPPARGTGARRGAGRRRADAAPARLEVRGRPLVDAAQGEDLSRRRGHRHRPPGRRGPAQGPAGRAAGRACQRHRLRRRHRLLRRRTRHPPADRPTITFRYQELSDAGVPRFPSYVGVRVAQ